MNWPIPSDYSEAIQNPSFCFDDPELRSGKLKEDHLGLPFVMSGTFACVYEINCNTKKYAVRCFTRHFLDQEERYQLISSYLQKSKLTYFVEFQFISKGIRVKSKWYPILKMEWSNGVSLNKYVESNLNNPDIIRDLAEKFLEMLITLHKYSIAHGDLQHGNILITNSEIKLVDYDGMFVPGLESKTSNEIGHPDYQHPKRSDTIFNKDLDNFSAWLIYTSLLALSNDPSLWQRLQCSEERLLFSRKDLSDPSFSFVFNALKTSSDQSIVDSAKKVESFLFCDLSQIPIPGKICLTITPSVPINIPNWIPIDNSQNKVIPPSNFDWISESLEPLYFTTDCSREQTVFVGATATGILLISIGGILNLISIPILTGIITCEFIILFFYYRKKYETLPEIKPLLDYEQGMSNLKSNILLKTKEYNQHLKQLKLINQEEKDKITQIGNRKNNIIKTEKDEIYRITNRMNAEIIDINRNKQNLINNRDSEKNSALKSLQNNYLNTELRKVIIDDHSIPGIGPMLLGLLNQSGIYSAADISNRIINIPYFGQHRVSVLLNWKNQVINRIQRSIPNSLPQSQTDSINQKYELQITSLSNKERDCHINSQKEIELLQNRYKQEHIDIKKNLQNIDVQYQKDREKIQFKIDKEKIKVNELNGQFRYREKYRIVYRDITLKNYLKKIVLLKR